ncbi:hypothetical protein GGI20_001022 [Coemansia sp. BCRC 34301]|nr:hypothetical protein GGI20_001022 [Coemansia sp. BCRC 34301]
MFGGIGARTDKQNQAYNVFGHLCIILSLYLRDKLWVDRSDSAEKYKASLFFNYLSAIWFSLANVIPYSALEAVVLLFVAGFTKQGAANTIFHVVHVMLMILMLIATILMFNTLDARGVDISVYMTQSVAFAILALALTVAIFTVVHACKAKTKSWFKIAVTLVRCTLLTLWASFMASRMFVSLDSLVRDSEAIPDWLTYIPNKGMQPTHGTISLYFLALSLHLRAVMNNASANTAAAYKASLFFGYFTAICIHEQAVASQFRLTISTRKGIKLLVSPAHFCFVVLVIAAMPTMFDNVNNSNTYFSVYSIRFVLCCMLAMLFAEMLLTLAVDRRSPGYNRQALLLTVQGMLKYTLDISHITYTMALSVPSGIYSTIFSVSKCILRPTSVAPTPFPTRNGRLPDSTVSAIQQYTTIPTFSTTTLLSSCTTSSSLAPLIVMANNNDRDMLAATNDFGVRDRSTIFCAAGDCARGRDWLTQVPNAAAAWTLGGIALVLGGLLFMSTVGWRNPGFLDGVLAMVSVAVSMVLRASIGYAANGTALYRASLFFNYFAGIQLCHLLTAMVLNLTAHFDPRITAAQIFAKTVSRLLSLCLTGLVVAAVIVMFNGDPASASSAGSHMVLAVLVVVLVVALAMAMAAAQIVAREGAVNYRKHVVAAILPLLALALWAVYMGVRTLVSVSNVARTNEVMFYFMNYVPLLMAGATLVLLNAPRLFNFEKC